jgi:hypothetical protein
METTPRPAKRNRIYGIVGTLAWMLLAFIAGICVGTHPEWIPNMPWAYNPSNDQSPQPAVGSSTQISQTQPSSMNQ